LKTQLPRIFNGISKVLKGAFEDNNGYGIISEQNDSPLACPVSSSVFKRVQVIGSCKYKLVNVVHIIHGETPWQD